jgi:hypothetical protein
MVCSELSQSTADVRVRDNQLVDTAAGKWKDSGDGGGIIPTGPDDEDDNQYDNRSDSSSIISDTYSAISSDLQEEEGMHDAGLDEDNDKGWLQKKAKEFTPNGIRKELLRKTMRWVACSYSEG